MSRVAARIELTEVERKELERRERAHNPPGPLNTGLTCPTNDYFGQQCTGLPVLFAGNRDEASCACSWRAPNFHKNGVDQVANASLRNRPAKAGANPKAISQR